MNINCMQTKAYTHDYKTIIEESKEQTERLLNKGICNKEIEAKIKKGVSIDIFLREITQDSEVLKFLEARGGIADLLYNKDDKCVVELTCEGGIKVYSYDDIRGKNGVNGFVRVGRDGLYLLKDVGNIQPENKSLKNFISDNKAFVEKDYNFNGPIDDVMLANFYLDENYFKNVILHRLKSIFYDEIFSLRDRFKDK
jgi:hypothetical protein